MFTYNDIETYKGIHPGKFISHQLSKSGISQAELARNVNVFPQALNAVVSCRRGIPDNMALRIEPILGLPEGFLSILQVLYDIKRIKSESSVKVAPPNIRHILFWDMNFDSIDWVKYKSMVFERVASRGTAEELEIIEEYYEQIEQLESSSL